MTWWTCIIPLLLLILPNVASNQKPECSPIKIEDIYAAAECSKMVYDYYDRKAEGKMVGKSNFKVVKEFNFAVDKGEAERRGFSQGEFLKAVIAQAKEDDDSTTTMFCFMGTKSPKQLIKQLISGASSYPTCIDPSEGTQLKTCSERSVGVFDYHWKTYEHYKKFITDDFVPMIVAGQKYVITGHSLGGALSSLLAMRMITVKNSALWKNRNSSLITFGQPRVGDAKFAKLIDTKIPNDQKMRFIYRKDQVPQVPSRQYWHHSSEIYITNATTSEDVWVVCPHGDTIVCGNYWGVSDSTPADHDMAHYLEAVKTMASSPDKVKQFMEDICMDGDSEILKALKEERERVRMSEVKEGIL